MDGSAGGGGVRGGDPCALAQGSPQRAEASDRPRAWTAREGRGRLAAIPHSPEGHKMARGWPPGATAGSRAWMRGPEAPRLLVRSHRWGLGWTLIRAIAAVRYLR